MSTRQKPGKRKNVPAKEYWRSMEQLADTPEFRRFVENEFPYGIEQMDNSWSRRNFLTLMGASLALAGLSGCRRPVEKIVPYVKAPEQTLPGIGKHYATAMPFGSDAYGLVAETHEGRPTKVEGNNQHPSTLGRSTALIQASILNLYDPDRSQSTLNNEGTKEYFDFVAWWVKQYSGLRESRGKGLAILSPTINSPTIARLKSEFSKAFPKATWTAYDSISDENIIKAIEVTTGRVALPVYHLYAADVIVAIDADPLSLDSQSITCAAGFAAGRRVTTESDSMNRLYVVETGFSLTGSAADNRLRLKNQEIGPFVVALGFTLQSRGLKLPGFGQLQMPAGGKVNKKWVMAVASDLIKAKGKSLVMVGRRQAPAIHAAALAINKALDNIGSTVSYHDAPDLISSDLEQLRLLCAEMKGGKVNRLVILGGNPVYDAPRDFEFERALSKVETSIHLGDHVDETARKATWHIPRAHYMEAWSDVRSVNGTASVVQPMIAPLFGGKSEVELLSLIASGEDKPGHDEVRTTWRDIMGAGKVGDASYEKRWRQILHDGLLASSVHGARKVTIKSGAVGKLVQACIAESSSTSSSGLEIVFHASPAVWDGSYANNGWMQEVPHPITKLTWDNAALLSPATAREYNLQPGDVVTLSYRGIKIEAPVWIVPGWTNGSIGLELGYGRTAAGRVGTGVGADFGTLRSSTTMHFASGATLAATGRQVEMANSQDHSSMEGRPLVREATIDEYRANPTFAPDMVEHPPLESLWNERKYTSGYQWGMAIDLNACIGCAACTVACQSENNIPIVGKQEVQNGREMHWMRIDRYFTGEIDGPEMVHQPINCQHCELAPCEQVCPVAATVHDKEGLNTMVYNRCIGTRYCANNCPYKVRRFNFFNYTNETPEIVKMVQNPDVTVRSRGVMEKCTYCVQRLNAGKKEAKFANEKVDDGVVQTACQQACPTRAISFGDLLNPKAEVVASKENDRNYNLLAELNIKPRTSYLARLRNPNPDLV